MAETVTVKTHIALMNWLNNGLSLNDTDTTVLVDPDPDESGKKVLDFNTNDLYYHTDNFLTIYKSFGSSDINLTIDFNNTTLSNAYVYPGYNFIYVNSTGNDSYTHHINFKNGIFEVVLNDGNFFNIIKNNSYAYGGNPTKITFRNCIFNIKATNMSDYKRLFLHRGMAQDSSDKDRWALKFINCLFNIEYVNCAQNQYVIACEDIQNTETTGSMAILSLSVQSCEFRIRNRSNSRIQIVNTRNGYVDFTNNVLFLNSIDNDTTIDYDGGHVSKPFEFRGFIYFDGDYKFVNNYIATFNYTDSINAPLNNPVGFMQWYNGSTTNIGKSFRVSNVIDVGSNNGNMIEVPLNDAKDPAKLTALGYIFAIET